jgi:hypothetical protein
LRPIISLWGRNYVFGDGEDNILETHALLFVKKEKKLTLSLKREGVTTPTLLTSVKDHNYSTLG